MEELLEILTNIREDLDYETEDKIIDNHLFDSLSIIMLIADLEETFDISIPTVEIIPENFNSAQNMYNLIRKLSGE